MSRLPTRIMLAVMVVILIAAFLGAPVSQLAPAAAVAGFVLAVTLI